VVRVVNNIYVFCNKQTKPKGMLRTTEEPEYNI